VNRDHNRYHRNWDRGWRNDRRYDWQNYRYSNRRLYSPGYYYSPYRDHSYSRFGIGVTLGSGFYSSRYWINDPWSYRLPEPFPGTRWIRYYNDVLLVDTFTGEVVDVIYDFFW
jgi:Ni/Co efflux regulator RcnB